MKNQGRKPEIRFTRIHITGIVQGVGFRPFIYGLAVHLGLNGWVQNTSAGVEIEVDGTNDDIKSFVNSIKNELPPLARIDRFEIAFGKAHGFIGFKIIPSETIAGAFQPISPDVSVCPDCLKELFDPSDRRFHYPFINCTNCGPRFTIITDIPYDRPNTTMSEFNLCPDCTAEYSNPLDRRFHAQPVACPVCGPQVWLEDSEGQRIADRSEAILAVQKMLLNGKIVAIKGLGGFHLACDATSTGVVRELRRRKLRVEKPFAVMMPDMATVEQHCLVSDAEHAILESHERPIVLLARKPGSLISDIVAPKQNCLGVMLPYTPIHYLLFAANTDKQQPTVQIPPLIMTSGNLSEEPIAISNDEARQRLVTLADAILMHNREIRMRCDDSVVRVIPDQENKPSPYFLRRSRGYAPDPIQLPVEIPNLLATGPELKNTFCITRERYAFLSQHIGDMENYETLRSFEDGIGHFEHLFRIQPDAIACDLHPDYLSSRYAAHRAEQNNLPLFRVQHHHAHIAACMADNGLDGSQPVIGLAFDGTGYGEDGAIWGGEFLLADYAGYQRLYHFDYFPLPGGDVAIKRPARTALALLWSLDLEWDEGLAPVKDLCFEERQALRIQLERGLNTPPTSSLGRLFDAVSSLTGMRQRVNYEAQAAMEFEAVLDPFETGAYRFDVGEAVVETGEVIQNLLRDFRSGVSASVISARFHNGLAELSHQVCVGIRHETGINEVALSGGVWQNKALLRKAISVLRRDGFIVYQHHQVPANDGGLSLGQALVGASKLAMMRS